ncbi:LysR family transcriptional regulator [Litoribacillus peritrichatus]|uniref:LysR substrate-binding domain-containing protein n=1 Tax=Litoribacillus peritrichatus TaxID=718191 RepID=A0ABP7NC35_9GAMM
MKLEELARYDIKLLVAFQVLLEEQNVSRAAERLYVTQSAMSKMMARLKDMFGEDLFFRTTHGIQPTERALALREPLYTALEHFKQLVEPPVFDPAECDRVFRVSLMDHIAVKLCPALLRTLSQVAPKVKLHIKPWTKKSFDEMASGQLDLAVNLVEIDRANFYQHEVVKIAPCAILRKDHPLIQRINNQGHANLDDFLSYSFIKMVIPEFNDTHQKDQAALAALGKERHIVLETHNINSALQSLRVTDYVMLGGKGINDSLFEQLGLTTLPIPKELVTPSFSYKAIWHQRQHKPPEQQWFRQLILDHLEF